METTEKPCEAAVQNDERKEGSKERRDTRKEKRRERKKEPVAKRHQMVTGSLALLNCFFYCFLYSYFNGSRAAAPVGGKVL